MSVVLENDAEDLEDDVARTRRCFDSLPNDLLLDLSGSTSDDMQDLEDQRQDANQETGQGRRSWQRMLWPGIPRAVSATSRAATARTSSETLR